MGALRIAFSCFILCGAVKIEAKQFGNERRDNLCRSGDQIAPATQLIVESACYACCDGAASTAVIIQ
jgi:hypothetical protein